MLFVQVHSVFTPYGYCDKSPRLGGSIWQKCILSNPRRPKVWDQGAVGQPPPSPQTCSGDGPLLGFSSLPAIIDVPPLCLSMTFSLCVSPWGLLLARMAAIAFRISLSPVWAYLNSITSPKTLRSLSQVLQYIFLGDMIQLRPHRIGKYMHAVCGHKHSRDVPFQVLPEIIQKA